MTWPFPGFIGTHKALFLKTGLNQLVCVCVCVTEREAEASFNPSGAGKDARLPQWRPLYSVWVPVCALWRGGGCDGIINSDACSCEMMLGEEVWHEVHHPYVPPPLHPTTTPPPKKPYSDTVPIFVTRDLNGWQVSYYISMAVRHISIKFPSPSHPRKGRSNPNLHCRTPQLQKHWRQLRRKEEVIVTSLMLCK